MMPIVKKAPTLVVIGVTGFVAYTVLFPEGDPGPSGAGNKPPAPARAAMPVAADSTRNPFQMVRPASMDPALVAETSKSRETVPLASKKGPEELAALTADEDRILESMKLVGTFVDRREQLAIIDNKIYARGDQLRGADGGTLPYVVTEIRGDRALVRRGRRDFVIAFSDIPRPSVAKTASPPKPGREQARREDRDRREVHAAREGQEGPDHGQR